MLITIALLFGAVSGLIIHFSLPERDTRGAALTAMVATTLAGAVWLGMTWAGLGETGWNWLASLAVPIAVTWPLTVLLTRARLAHDQRERVRLKIV